MRRFIATILILGLLFFLTGCNSSKAKEDPQITLNFIVSDLTDEQYSHLATSGLANHSKRDFKVIEFTLYLQNSKNIKERRISFPDDNDLIKKANSYDDVERYWFGSWYESNEEDTFAECMNKFIFYSKGLTKQDIKNIFGSVQVNISWLMNDGTHKVEKFTVGDFIQFE